METAPALTNDFLSFRLWNLAPSIHTEEAEPTRGPYMVVQEGSAPGDPTAMRCSFILTQRGTWVPGFVFFALSEEWRRKIGHFETVQEVYELTEKLLSTPILETATSLGKWIGASQVKRIQPAVWQAFSKAPVLEAEACRSND